MEIQTNKNYFQTLETIKSQIKTSQIKAALSVNKELILLYWNIGKIILNKQIEEGWGTRIVKRLSEDLQKEFSGIRGFSYTNINYMLIFAKTYPDLQTIFHQAGGKLENRQILHQPGAKLNKNSIFHQAGGKLKNNINQLILNIPFSQEGICNPFLTVSRQY